MRKLPVVMLSLLLLASFGVEALAQQAKQGKGGFSIMRTLRPPSENEMNAIASRLELTEEQRADMQTKYAQYRSELQQLGQNYQEAQQNLRNAFQGNGEPDPARVENALKELHRIHRSILDTQMQLWDALSNNLTKQQTEQFWTMFAETRLKMPAQAQKQEQDFDWYPED
jgi:Spy/CpxP family protein refolding chaperone